jgi:hypothetical protein
MDPALGRSHRDGRSAIKGCDERAIIDYQKHMKLTAIKHGDKSIPIISVGNTLNDAGTIV